MKRTHWRASIGTVVVGLLLCLSPPPANAAASPDPVGAEQPTSSAVPWFHPGRVATFNACNPCDRWPGTNTGAIARYIAHYRPQVIGLQEICVGDVSQILALLRLDYGMTYYRQDGSVLEHLGRCGGTPWNPGNYGNALLSVTPLSDAEHGEYPEGGTEDRGYVYATTKIHGIDTRVVVTHLAQGGQSDVRARQVAHLLNQINPDSNLPVIAVGDFNAVPDATEVRPMWNLFRDADPGCTQEGPTTCKITHPGSRKKFDYIWAERKRTDPPGVVVTDTFSDHHGVYADFPQ